MIDGSHPLESAFSQIEGESNLAIKELISCENVGELYQENFINLCKFVGLQYVRTEEKRIQIEETGNFALRELFAADHPEFDKDLVKGFLSQMNYYLEYISMRLKNIQKLQQ